MADAKSFQCPNCGSPVLTTGEEKELKCAYCGSTVIVPEELRDHTTHVEINFGQPEQREDAIVQTIQTVGKVTAGVTAMSIALPIILTCIILGAVGGILFSVFSNLHTITQNLSAPTSAPVVASATEIPTDTSVPIATPMAFSKLLFSDNFTDPSSGWSKLNSPSYTLEYKGGKYHILINKQDGGQASWISNTYTDVSVEADAQETAGPNDGLMGVACRTADDGRMYTFEFSQDGSYGIYKSSADGSEDALDEGFLSPVTVNANGVNHIEGVCAGDTLTLLLNAQILSQVHDSDYTSGGTGLIVRTGSSGQPGIDVLFSNYMVKGP